MDSHHIATTSQKGLRPVGRAGARSYTRLVEIIRQGLDDDHAALLAEPVPAPDGSTIDWYGPHEGDAVPLEQVNPEIREAAEEELDTLRSGILSFADTLDQSGSSTDRENAASLRQAMEVPDLSYVRVIDGHPILLAWSYTKDAAGDKSTVLQALIEARALRRRHRRPPPKEETPAAAGPTTLITVPAHIEDAPFPWLAWLLWLILALLLAAIMYLLLSGCGVGFPGRAWLEERGFVNRCPIAVAEAAVARSEEDRGPILRSQIRKLELGLARREAICRKQRHDEARAARTPAPTPTPTPAPKPPSVEDSEIDRRLEKQGAKSGDYQVTLAWNGRSDLDLIVACPAGGQIYWKSRETCGGGVLDIDMNRKDISADPVENVTWPAGVPTSGRYRVFVKLYDRRDDSGAAIPFTVRVKLNGRVTTTEGVVDQANKSQFVSVFDVP